MSRAQSVRMIAAALAAVAGCGGDPTRRAEEPVEAPAVVDRPSSAERIEWARRHLELVTAMARFDAVDRGSCAFYFDQDDRPALGRSLGDRCRAEIDRLAAEIAEVRASLDTPEARIAFERDVGEPFETLRVGYVPSTDR
jgi:hypothetical protein